MFLTPAHMKAAAPSVNHRLLLNDSVHAGENRVGLDCRFALTRPSNAALGAEPESDRSSQDPMRGDAAPGIGDLNAVV